MWPADLLEHYDDDDDDVLMQSPRATVFRGLTIAQLHAPDGCQ